MLAKTFNNNHEKFRLSSCMMRSRDQGIDILCRGGSSKKTREQHAGVRNRLTRRNREDFPEVSLASSCEKGVKMVYETQ